jgi:hypothetical protein
LSIPNKIINTVLGVVIPVGLATYNLKTQVLVTQTIYLYLYLYIYIYIGKLLDS